MQSLCGWYKVQVVKASRYEKSYLINLIRDYVKPYDFEYYNFIKLDGETYSFYVSNFDMAEKLYLSRGRIKTVTSHTLTLVVHANTPYIEVNDALKEKIKLVMAKRYNAQTNALDLSNFHNDPDFRAGDFFVPLDRTNVMSCVCNIIKDNLPQLYALNLSDNKIYYRESLSSLAKVAPQLKILYLANNNIKDLNTVKSMEGLAALEELKLEKNPWAEKFDDESTYTYEVKKVFPKLLKLDNIVLPPPIVFDIEETVSLPKPQGSFLCFPEAGAIARTFLEQYFTLFDTETRDGLKDAYHEKAQYSMNAIMGIGNNAFIEYHVRQGRNLLRQEDPVRQKVLLSVGRTEIVRSLQLFPATKHDLSSFTCDCPIFSPGLIQLTVCGLFEEVRESSLKKKIVRSFNRVFLLIPNGFGGFAIINDQLTITSATVEQYSAALKTLDNKAKTGTGTASSSAAQASTSSSTNEIVVSNELIIKQNMVRTLSQTTGMNLAFSENCLNEVQWDYDKAIAIFNELKANNGIPAEAFV